MSCCFFFFADIKFPFTMTNKLYNYVFFIIYGQLYQRIKVHKQVLLISCFNFLTWYKAQINIFTSLYSLIFCTKNPHHITFPNLFSTISYICEPVSFLKCYLIKVKMEKVMHTFFKGKTEKKNKWNYSTQFYRNVWSYIKYQLFVKLNPQSQIR